MMRDFLISITLVAFLSSCSNQLGSSDNLSSSAKNINQLRDSTQVEKLIERESQRFTFKSDEPAVLQGEEGTTIALAEGSLLNADGTPYKGEVNLKMYEAISAANMIKANLATMADDTLLKTGGMLYFDVKDTNGNELKIDPNKPGRVEMPTDKVEEGMMLYEGVADSVGNINWANPKPLETYLTPVDIFSLDFLPPNFSNRCKELVKLDTNISISKQVDSIYYSLAAFNPLRYKNQLKRDLVKSYNEPFANQGSKVENWEYVDGSYIANKGSGALANIELDLQQTGVNPAVVKTIRDAKFNNTLIATHEFQERLQVLFYNHFRADKLIEMYINNLDKNMWEMDEMVLAELKKSQNSEAAYLISGDGGGMYLDSANAGYYTEYCTIKYEEFVKQKAGKVPTSESAKALANYYNRQIKSITKQLDKTEEKMIKAVATANKKFDKEVKKYKKLLFQREKFRFEKYGWDFTETGWKNVDKPVRKGKAIYVQEEKCDWQPLNATIIEDYDRVYVYAVLLELKSLYRLNTNDDHAFYAGNPSNSAFPFPCTQSTKMVMVGYRGEQIYFAEQLINLPYDTTVSFNARSVTEKQLNALLKETEFKKENSIKKDLEFQEMSYKNYEMNRKFREGILTKYQLCEAAFPRFFSATNVRYTSPVVTRKD